MRAITKRLLSAALCVYCLLVAAISWQKTAVNL